MPPLPRSHGSALGRAVCAVVVNWNGWPDTIVCLESLFSVIGHPLSVVICDNGSTDSSASRLKAWLRFRCACTGAQVGSTPFVSEAVLFDHVEVGSVDSIHLLVLANNLGYAGGLNCGIRWAQERLGAVSFWLLNNDVKAEPHALRHIIAAKDAVPRAGLCGSVLLDWAPPHRVQAVGGIYHKFLAVGWHLQRLRSGADEEGVRLDLDYPVGASLFVEQDYLERVGFMDDSYFLYYEEMDWVERGRRLGLRPVVALGSRVFHKEGASTGSHGGVRRKSLLSEHYGVVNRLRITRRFWPALLPLVWLSLWLVVLDRTLHGEGRRAWLVLRLMFSPRQWMRDPPPVRPLPPD